MLLIENLDTGNSAFNKIALPTETGFELVKTILYCEADSIIVRLMF
jgi:two-component system LytT family response regulator